MEEQTCGRGLAEHSVLPAQLAEVTDAMADNLMAHMQALELDDEAARQEHAVYLRLAEEQRQAAARLRAVAGEMAAARDLPMGRHDPQTMSSPEVAHAFRRFVEARQELLAVLRRMAEQDQRMLAEMRQAPSG
jgi:adenosine deaminase